jgi:hypothetical protein
MFLRAEEPSSPRITLSGIQNAALLVLLVPTLLLGLYFSPLVQLAQASVRLFGTP